MTDRGRRSWSGARLAAVIVAALVLVGCGDTAADDAGPLRGLTREPSPEVDPVTLPDATADGAEFAFVADDDRLLVVYFGYTSCPDVCPTTLSDLSAALRTIDADLAGQVDLAMVTIDPDRDTAEVLTGYVQSFVPEAHALVTDDPDRLRAAADAFGVTYSVDLQPDGRIDVVHSSSLFVIDDGARIPVIWPFGTVSDDMANDLEVLLARA